MNIGQRIRKQRKNKNISMKELGLRVGLSEQAIGNYERGERTPSTEILIKISEALDIPIGELEPKLQSSLRFKEAAKIWLEISLSDSSLVDLNPVENIIESEKIKIDNEVLHSIMDLQKDLTTKILKLSKNNNLKPTEIDKISEYLSNQLDVIVKMLK